MEIGMSILRSAVMAGALLIATPSLLSAQTNPVGPANDRLSAIAPTESTKSATSKDNAGSMLTEGQVRKRLEKRGFEHVREVTPEKGGGFTARATRDGRTMTVVVDKEGRIIAK